MPLIRDRDYMCRPHPVARILLVIRESRELIRYRTILENLGCDVRVTSSFSSGVQYVREEPFDLIFLDQGSSNFEGLKVLACAMEIDTELRVLVMALSYDSKCRFKAMHSGALDYLEAPLTAMRIIGLLDMFLPCRAKRCEESWTRRGPSCADCRIEYRCGNA